MARGAVRRPPKLVVVDVDNLDDITPQQQLFVDAYVEDPRSASAAARKVGICDRDAQVTARTWLNMRGVAARVAMAMNERAERTKINQDRALHECAILALSDVMHYEFDEYDNVQLKEGVPGYATRAIRSIKRKTRTMPRKDGEPVVETTVEIQLHPKTDALRLMMQHLGMLVDRHGLVGADGKLLDPAKTMSDEEIAEEMRRFIADQTQQSA
jgi:phage terminase small subunit